MPDLIINLIIVALVCGFFLWVWARIRPLMPIAEPFGSIVDVLIYVLIGAIVLFYFLIPLLRSLGHISMYH